MVGNIREFEVFREHEDKKIGTFFDMILQGQENQLDVG